MIAGTGATWTRYKHNDDELFPGLARRLCIDCAFHALDSEEVEILSCATHVAR